MLKRYEDFVAKHFPEAPIDEIAELILPSDRPTDPAFRVVRELLSGEIDADKLAYLLDDAYFCGVTYGAYDVRRFIETSRAFKDSTGAVRQALEWGGLHAAEGVIVCRYQMLIQVYYHRTRRIYDRVLAEFLNRLLPKRLPQQLDDYLAWDDAVVFARAREVLDDPARSDDLRLWAERLLNRRHLTAVFDPPTIKFDELEARKYLGGVIDLKQALTESLGSEGEKWFEDDASKLPHQLTSDSGKDIVVLDERDHPASLYVKSPIVRALTERIRLYRIYAELEWEDELSRYREIWQARMDVEDKEFKRIVPAEGRRQGADSSGM